MTVTSVKIYAAFVLCGFCTDISYSVMPPRSSRPSSRNHQSSADSHLLPVQFGIVPGLVDPQHDELNTSVDVAIVSSLLRRRTSTTTSYSPIPVTTRPLDKLSSRRRQRLQATTPRTEIVGSLTASRRRNDGAKKVSDTVIRSDSLASNAADTTRNETMAVQPFRPMRKWRMRSTTTLAVIDSVVTVPVTTISTPAAAETESRCCRVGRKWSRVQENCTLAVGGRRREWHQLTKMSSSKRDQHLLSRNLVQRLQQCVRKETDREETVRCCLEQPRRSGNDIKNREKTGRRNKKVCGDVMTTRLVSPRKRCRTTKAERWTEAVKRTTTTAMTTIAAMYQTPFIREQ